MQPTPGSGGLLPNITICMHVAACAFPIHAEKAHRVHGCSRLLVLEENDRPIGIGKAPIQPELRLRCGSDLVPSELAALFRQHE